MFGLSLEDEGGRLKALRQPPLRGSCYERLDGKSAFKQGHDHAESVSTKRFVLAGDAFPYPTSHAVDVLDGKVSEKLSVGFGILQMPLRSLNHGWRWFLSNFALASA